MGNGGTAATLSERRGLSRADDLPHARSAGPAACMAAAGIRHTLRFLPDVTDVRPWQWEGLLAGRV